MSLHEVLGVNVASQLQAGGKSVFLHELSHRMDRLGVFALHDNLPAITTP